LAYLVYQDENAHQRSFPLDVDAERVRIGRGEVAELRLAWDKEVSRVHAELEQLGDTWAVIDDGLSANGTYVNGERLAGRRRLAAGDEIRVGGTGLVFRATNEEGSATFIPAVDEAPAVQLSRMQRAVLVALCRPFRVDATKGLPATNQQIADELYVSVDAVKMHLRALFQKFAISELPQNQKRARLAVLAFERGVIGEHDL
jgi:hypothetical protein